MSILIKKNKASFAIEYCMLIIILVAALLLMQYYIIRAFAGRWRTTGDVFGFGKQYEPDVTVVCEGEECP
ncbi:MAG: hypothetical protein Q8O13_11240 [Candidatus Omnitrophota bacterium]|nr:hypothetical protein [Candidatus Omnitrophota bacterium]